MNAKKSIVVLWVVMIAEASFGQQKPLQISIQQIADGFYVHTSYSYLDGQPFPSNGLIVSTSSGVLLVDTGWDEPQTAQILSWVDSTLQKPVTLCIVTHFHGDRLGGVKILHDHDIPVLSTRLTETLAPPEEARFLRAILPNDSTFVLGQTSVRVFLSRRRSHQGQYRRMVSREENVVRRVSHQESRCKGAWIYR